jgi:hypothetical protein
MVFQVDMAAGPRNHFRWFSCNCKTWEEALELARQHGWRPLGTVPTEPEDWSAEKPFNPSYEPYDFCFEKKVKSVDARNLANALAKVGERMKSGQIRPRPRSGPVYIMEKMTGHDLLRANSGVSPAFLEQFTAFLRQGAFKFGWDD